MDVAGIEAEMSYLDGVYRPVAQRPVDPARLKDFVDVAAAIEADLRRLGVDNRAQLVLDAVVEAYVGGDEPVRVAIRGMFDRYPSFRWAAHPPRQWHTAEEFRARLILMSARDQGADTRDEILELQGLCDQASRAGIDVDAVLDEVAAMSSDVDRYGMGSMRAILLRYGKRGAARTAFDHDEYARRVSEGPCFVCAFLDGHPDYQHHVVFEDEDTVAFLSRYPTLLGYCLVAPKRHLESWVHDMEQPEFLRFQGIVHAVARAIAATVPTERMYSMSLGSKQGNAHLHWHLAPLPPGVPYHQQQFHAVMAENGVLAVGHDAQAALAGDIRSRIRVL